MKKSDLNIPVKVTKEQYHKIRIWFAGIVAHRTENGKYYIKRLWPGTRKEVEMFLNEKGDDPAKENLLFTFARRGA